MREKLVSRGINAIGIVLAGSITFGATAAFAAWPERPVRWVVGFSPGGGADATARIIAAELSKKWGQPVIIDNMAGASGVLAADVVAKAAPDGYTIDFATLNHTVTPSLRSLPFNPIRDFAPVIEIGQHPDVLLVNPSLGVNNVKELIALAKASPGKLNYGSTGTDGPFLEMEAFEKAAGIDLVDVTYVANAPVVTALLGGEIQAAFAGADVTAGMIRGGQLEALAVTSDTRLPQLPNVPTVSEAANIPGYNEGTWYGVLAPAHTSDTIVDKIHDDIAAVLHMPDISQRLETGGLIFVDNTPAQFGTFMQKDLDKWASLLKSTGTK